MKKFLLIGTGGYSNRGCEAIIRGTVEILSKRFPHSKFILSPFSKTVQNDSRGESDTRIEYMIPREIGRAHV